MKNDNSEHTWSEEMLEPFKVGRRDFIKLSGGGLFVLFSVGNLFSIQQSRRRGYPEDFNAYLKIEEDGRVTCFCGKIEMGQDRPLSL